MKALKTDGFSAPVALDIHPRIIINSVLSPILCFALFSGCDSETEPIEPNENLCVSDLQVYCEGSCIDPLTSNDFCGADKNCETYKACAETESCQSGSCQDVVCPQGQLVAKHTCVDDNPEKPGPEPPPPASNCLENGDICGENEVCIDGHCVREDICTDENYPVSVFENSTEDLMLTSETYPGEHIAELKQGVYSLTVTNALPIHRFEVEIGKNHGITKLCYRGRSKNGERLALYAYHQGNQSWTKLDSGMTDGDRDMILEALIDNELYVSGGKLSALVTMELAANGSDSILLTGDSQNYTTPSYWTDGKSNGIYNQIMTYVRDQYLAGNIAYFHHVGDICESGTGPEGGPDGLDGEWMIADEAHRIIDDAGVPNGISVGNHDNYYKTKLREYNVRPWYDKYFPATRYEGNIWYGGHYDNNYNSYTLVTIANRDFVFVNIGYDAYPYAWAKAVFQKYSHRIGVLATHNYLLRGDHASTDGKPYTRPVEGERKYQNLVVPNDNILLVLCGHVAQVDYSIHAVDGKPNRKVTEIVVDHTNLYPEGKGAEGYLRWIHFRDNKIINRTYSPYRDDWRTAADGAGEEWEADFVLPDTERFLQTTSFEAVSECRCTGNEMCSSGKICIDERCVCPENTVACGMQGQCIAETDEVCGEYCTDCASSGAVCSQGVCECPLGFIPVYDDSHHLLGCETDCGGRTCGDGAICIQNDQFIKKCYCGSLDADICERDGVCGDQGKCACDDSAVVYQDTNKSVRLGCMTLSTATSKMPSQISLSLAKSETLGVSSMSFNWVTTPDTEGGELRIATTPDMTDFVTEPATVQQPDASSFMPENMRSEFKPIYAYTAVANNLIPGKTYYYQVGNKKDGFSETQSFVAKESSEKTTPSHLSFMPIHRATQNPTLSALGICMATCVIVNQKRRS